MDELQIILRRKIDEITNIIEKAEKCLAESPEGLLHISKNQNTIQYYHRTKPSDTHGIYIRKTEVELLEKLAQKEYAKKMFKQAMIERNTLQKCLDKYQPDGMGDVYLNLMEPKKKLVKPYVLSDEDYIEK